MVVVVVVFVVSLLLEMSMMMVVTMTTMTMAFLSSSPPLALVWLRRSGARSVPAGSARSPARSVAGLALVEPALAGPAGP